MAYPRILSFVLAATFFLQPALAGGGESPQSKPLVGSRAFVRTACAVLVIGSAAVGVMKWGNSRNGESNRWQTWNDREFSRLAAQKHSFHYGHGIIWNRDFQVLEALLTDEERDLISSASKNQRSSALARVFTPLFSDDINKSYAVFLVGDFFENPVDVSRMVNRSEGTLVQSEDIHKCIALHAVLQQQKVTATIVSGVWSTGGSITDTRWFVWLPEEDLFADPSAGTVLNRSQMQDRFKGFIFSDRGYHQNVGVGFSDADKWLVR